MSETFHQVLDQSIQLELNLARLYTLFNDTLPEDEEFWWDLAMEEQGHASLLRQEKNQPQQSLFFPENLLASDLKALEEANAQILSLIERYSTTKPTRTEALQTAYNLELSAGESHFQQFLDSPESSYSAKLFKQLNQQDRDHAARIQQYMQENDIPTA